MIIFVLSPMVISNEHILTLKSLDGFGPATIRTIAEYVLSLSFNSISLEDLMGIMEDLMQEKKIKGSAAKHFPSFNDLSRANCQAQEILKQSEDMGIKMVSQFDKTFPEHLLKTVDEGGKLSVPMYLFYKGDLSITRKKAVAIIGTREPSFDGIKAGEYIAERFADTGFNIVSGLALGCDTSAHKGALKAKFGVTTAFLAHGLDTVYPPENAYLAEEIVAEGGLLMSE